MADLRSLINDRGLIQLMATHAPLSARLAEEAGYDGCGRPALKSRRCMVWPMSA